jgi:DNA-binding NtrC family response regulator
VHLPPLRDREDDVILLASHFLAHHCKRFGIPARRFSQSALDLMRGYRWRGNIRELSHTIESCLLQSAGETIEADDLRLSSGETIEQGGFAVELTNGRKIVMDFERQRPTLDEVEHAILVAAYEHTGQNLSRAARILGITREALRYRLNKGVESVQTEG